MPVDRLRKDAYEAASEAVDAAPREAKRLYHRRSAAAGLSPGAIACFGLPRRGPTTHGVPASRRWTVVAGR